MKFLLKILITIPKRILSFVWSLIFSLIKTIVFLALIILALMYYANHSSSPVANQLSNFFETVTTVLDNSSFANPNKLGEQLAHLETDSHEHLDGARWSTNSATIYIATENSTFRLAYQEAIEAWNQTGAFHFKIVDQPGQAKIIAKDYSDPSTQAAGLANTKTNALTNRLVSVEVFLNTYYLSNPDYGYSQERIVNTAIHELGHAIGLEHDDEHDSVMQSAGSYYGIQEVDIRAVNQLYADKNEAA
ncbi:matrixin family metalloprotease [Streptococcus thoraltensis]|uniref:matrixin family metalloprotease n=1 Tax=Streptococcus thoraltensis TaxID=55085 RepID=UPI000378C644|nr:M57 family metalloprotease [Streptococcus thoraltensis]MDY4760622.1 M57 family metalloprotease [Streptococcus thoraltensis]